MPRFYLENLDALITDNLLIKKRVYSNTIIN